MHCPAGRGRTTTFLAMYDMMRNAVNVSFDDILARQAMIGGKDLTEPFAIGDWRYEHHFERLQFLMDFYNYCLENPNFEKIFSGLPGLKKILNPKNRYHVSSHPPILSLPSIIL